MKKIEVTQEQTKEIINLYTKGWGRRRIAKKMPFSDGVITRILKENNIKMNNTIPRKYQCNQDVFSIINSAEKAYWLGFLYADGCVSRNSLIIRLSIKDKSHLNKFNDFMESNALIKTGWQNSFGTTTEYANLTINSIKVVQDLIKLGCIYQKSLILKFPKISQVPEKFIFHFIRGYFDGDGSIIKNKTGNYCVAFEGTELFLTALKEKMNITNKLEKRKKSSKTFYVRAGGNLQVLEILNKLYQNSSVHLDRKYQRFLELKHQYPLELIKERSKYSCRL